VQPRLLKKVDRAMASVLRNRKTTNAMVKIITMDSLLLRDIGLSLFLSGTKGPFDVSSVMATKFPIANAQHYRIVGR
jgi:hypothetical protein